MSDLDTHESTDDEERYDDEDERRCPSCYRLHPHHDAGCRNLGQPRPAPYEFDEPEPDALPF